VRNLPALTLRETKAFFLAPFSYLVTALFLILTGVFFYVPFRVSWALSATVPADEIAFLSVLFVPLLTMRLFAEEKATGTIETLMTAPVTAGEVVLAKFTAAFLFYAFMLVPTLSYYAIVRIAGKPDVGPMVAQYVGMLLMGGLCVAVGFFTSTLTRSQVLAAFMGIVVLLLMWFLDPIARLATEGDLTSTWFRVGSYLSPMAHLRAFEKGIIDASDVCFFLSLTIYVLFLSVRSVEVRKWS
jgi:gliding motility-associated transport system permease protein